MSDNRTVYVLETAHRYKIISSGLRGLVSKMKGIILFSCLLLATAIMNSFFLAFAAYLEALLKKESVTGINAYQESFEIPLP